MNNAVALLPAAPKAIVVMRPRKVFAIVTARDHMLCGHRVEVTGRGMGGRVFATIDGVELVFAKGEIEEVRS